MGNATTIEETFAMINRGYSFNKTEFQEFIKNHQIVNYEAIQSYRSETVTKESFKRGYEEELKRRKKLIAKIKKQMYSDKQKLDGVRVLLNDANQNTQYNKYGIMINSKLDITLIEPRHLPPMNINGSCDPFVVVTVNDEDVYQSEVISTQQGQRVYWKESLSIPIESGSECITLSVFDNNEQQGNQFIGGFAVYLETLFDQEVHRRWYDLEFEDIRQGGMKVQLQ